ncbi:amidohydrolase family protein [Pelagicoccus sp. SDUM812002]|uniref:amidohydrolase family protein n=1 Tax=Pelagicoccus sp. SDUM812002 TaxID=3041266 RepID=UPI00280F0319|nr:amidohydrolase family protein [Pelagicoccus sp. SDUM812002]MDQ8187758.1 amidohydrolase family protein [Pelagicoccus sp. SDUM812002]
MKLFAPNSSTKLKAVRGRLLNPMSDTDCQLYQDALLVGRFHGGEWLVDAIGPAKDIATSYGWNLKEIPSCEGTLLPPFYDTHFHWVQDDVRQMPKASLLEWLERYTFPEEARFEDPAYAENKAKAFWSRILGTGTAGGLCYSSIHDTALDAAMKYAPPCFRIGGAMMTMNCPDFLRQRKREAIAAARYGVETYGDRYCVSPRFAPTTHPEVMKETAKLANKNGLFQQTHLDETRAEIEWVLGIYSDIAGFEDVETYTEIYERCGVLGPRTVMGHAIHLEETELELLARSDTAIASCPSSNAPVDDDGLGSGLFNFEQVEERGIRWALASDIGGGPYLSMFDVMSSFVSQNRDEGVFAATYCKALYRSTLAGAQILGHADHKGNFATGKSFDFIECIAPPSDAKCGTAEELLLATIGQAQNRSEFDNFVLRTIIDGQSVFEKEPLIS